MTRLGHGWTRQAVHGETKRRACMKQKRLVSAGGVSGGGESRTGDCIAACAYKLHG